MNINTLIKFKYVIIKMLFIIQTFMNNIVHVK